ncbi:hypothetical protein Tco_1083238 [Tanacetum coccineum]
MVKPNLSADPLVDDPSADPPIRRSVRRTSASVQNDCRGPLPYKGPTPATTKVTEILGNPNRSDEEKNLATYLVKAMKENRLFEIVEPRVVREGTLEQLQVVGDLVKRCLNIYGDDRPNMKEVAMELEGMKKFKTHPWGQQQTNEEYRSLTLEVEQSDLYDVPLIPYGTNEWESYSGGSTSMTFLESKPR